MAGECIICGVENAEYYLAADPSKRTCSRNCQQIRAGEYPLQTNPTPAQIEAVVARNKRFRQVFYTNRREPGAFQMVAMYVSAADYVGWERHLENSQYFKLLKGGGIDKSAQLLTTPAQPVQENALSRDANNIKIKEGDVWMIEPGQWHDVHAGDEGMHLLSIYLPPHHPDDRMDQTRQDAEAREAAEANADLTPAEVERLDNVFTLLANAIQKLRPSPEYSQLAHEGINRLFNGPILKPAAVAEFERRVPEIVAASIVPPEVWQRGGTVFQHRWNPKVYVVVSSGMPYVQIVMLSAPQ